MKDLKSFRNFFSPTLLAQKVRLLGTKAGVRLTYTLLLLFYAYRQKDTPFWAKNIVLGVLGYFIAPIDGIPDLTPFVGYTDDFGMLTFGLVTIAAYISKEVRLSAKTAVYKLFPKANEHEFAEVDCRL